MSLPKQFSEKENQALLAQSLRVYHDRLHPGLAKVKTRSAVNRTKKKLYQQKGTGGARHGARSAPIFVGGGVAHGPKGLKRKLSLSKKMAQKALQVSLALKAKDKKVVVVTGLKTLQKTKEAQKLINKLQLVEGKPNKKIMIALSRINENQLRFFKNIENLKIKRFADLNARDVFLASFVAIDKEALGEK